MEPPPPPELPLWSADEPGPRPTYWLFSQEGGIIGPYTKKQARKVVRDHPGETYLARRDGDGVWHDPAMRLQDRKSGGISASTAVGIFLIVCLGVGGYFWWKKQSAPKSAPSAPPAIEQTAPGPATAPAQ